MNNSGSIDDIYCDNIKYNGPFVCVDAQLVGKVFFPGKIHHLIAIQLIQLFWTGILARKRDGSI